MRGLLLFTADRNHTSARSAVERTTALLAPVLFGLQVLLRRGWLLGAGGCWARVVV
jgi:hypothetical protein